MSNHIRIMDVRGRGLAEQELTTIRSAGSEEDYVSYRTKPKRHIEIDYEIRAKDKESLRKKIDEISPLFMTKEMVPVVFPDENERTYYVEYDGADESLEYHHIGIHRGTLFLLRDKYKYSEEQTLELEDISTIENKGTAEANPIFELTAKEKATFAMVSNGADEDAEYNLIGTPTDVNEEIVDSRELLIEERGQTLDNWTESGTEIDGTVSGDLSTDNDGITVAGYGPDTDSGWHGPALMQEINPIQDFEVEAMVQGRTSEVTQTYRIEFYLFDENMNQLGKMAIIDRKPNMHQKQAEGRFGDKLGYDSYPISSQNYQYNWDFFYGMIRMRRVGNQFEFYVTRISNRNNHVYSLKETYTDIDNEYMGRLRYVQIHIGKYGSTDRAYGPKFNHIKVYELKEAVIDQTPYIIYPGDTVTFDHKSEDLLLNGEPRNDLKNFGGSFFTLKKGFNNVIVTPADTFDSKVIYQDKYL